MHPKIIENVLGSRYAQCASAYRQNDERDIRGPDHVRIASILGAMCNSLRPPLQVLDLGCGTGRYFHALRGVEKLTGVDVSPEMLKEAKNPVGGCSVPKIELLCQNFYTANFPAKAFHLIYCFGVFGNGCYINVELAQKLFKWLRPEGKIYFDVTDATRAPLLLRMRMRVKWLLHSAIPRPLAERWVQKSGWLPFFYTTAPALKRILARAGFEEIRIESVSASLPEGQGYKFECRARKPEQRI